MRDEYFVPMNEIVLNTQTETGYELPEDVTVYVSALLSSFIDKPDFLPERSFSEAYYKLQHKSSTEAKELGDTCLFLSGVFSGYGKRYGLNKGYYKEIGSSSYYIASYKKNNLVFSMLSKNFDFVADFITLCTNKSKYPILKVRYES